MITTFLLQDTENKIPRTFPDSSTNFPDCDRDKFKYLRNEMVKDKSARIID